MESSGAEIQEVELGTLARPAPDGRGGVEPLPAIVLIPDVRGLYDHFRELAARLGEAGFLVLAIDLYRRDGPPVISDVASALAWMRGLDDTAVLADVQAAIDFLAAHPDSSGRVGVTGFCMGGQYALLAACSGRGLSACVAFYGMLTLAADVDRVKKPRSVLEAIVDLRCPVLGLYGDEDPLIPLDAVRALDAGLAASGQPGEVVVYPGAGHAFVNDTQPDRYRPEAARDAWARMLAFFRDQLRA